MRRGVLCLAWMTTVIVAGGCGQRDAARPPSPSSLTPAQDAALKEYLPLLEEQVQVVEQSAAVLASVGEDATTKEAARGKLLQLSVTSEALERRLREKLPADPPVIVAAQQRVAQRRQQAAQNLLTEVRRVNRMPGGEDFFQKELRPLLDAAKGR